MNLAAVHMLVHSLALLSTEKAAYFKKTKLNGEYATTPVNVAIDDVTARLKQELETPGVEQTADPLSQGRGRLVPISLEDLLQGLAGKAEESDPKKRPN